MTAFRTPPVTQGAVLAKRAQGCSKRRIARDLGIDKATVDRILVAYDQSCHQTLANTASRVQQILPHAYDAVETAVKAGNARIAMSLLRVTDLADRQVNRFTISGDVHVQAAMALLPPLSERAPSPALIAPANIVEAALGTPTTRQVPPDILGTPSPGVTQTVALEPSDATGTPVAKPTLGPSTEQVAITVAVDDGTTEAAAKPPPQDTSLRSPTNFSQFSDAELEAELARRRGAHSDIIDAETADVVR